MPFFWAIYFQIFSLWIIMAENMDTTIFGFSIPAASITSLNPLMVETTLILHDLENILFLTLNS
jgi:dipeptide/tripeptide permease